MDAADYQRAGLYDPDAENAGDRLACSSSSPPTA